MGFIIDTCIWVDVERGALSPMDVELFTGKNPVFITPITIAELTFGMEMSKNEAIRSKRQAALNRLKRKPMLIIDELTADLFGRISAGLYKSGKQHRHRVNDLWIASLAIQHDFTLLTENTKDFIDIAGLQLIDLKTNG
jgi:predicted nucleic acid-binding protein